MYGRKVDNDGREISADSDFISPQLGTPEKPYVENVKFTGIELNEDNTRATLSFQQENGSVVKFTEFSSEESWAQDNTSRRLKHICTKIVSEEKYNEAVGETESFKSFIKSIIKLIKGKVGDKKFRVKFIYNKKNYVSLPNYPNFFESMDVPQSETKISYNPTYDKFEKSESDIEENHSSDSPEKEIAAAKEEW